MFQTSDYELWLSRRLSAFLPDGDTALTPAKRLPTTMYANDVLTGAFTVVGEARGLSYDGKIAVAHTFANRHAQKPDRSITSLCLAPWQYSCWTPGGGRENYVWLLSVVQSVITAIDKGDVPGPQSFPLVNECMYLVGGVLTGALPDNTKGATHYYVKGTKEPDWAKGKTPCAIFGPHLFFNNIPW